MIYRLFNINKPIVLTTLPIICLGLWFPSFIHDGPKLFFSNYSLLDFYESLPATLSQIIAILIILTTAILISYIVNGSELFAKNQYLSAMLYVMVISSVNEHHVLNPIIIANFFIVFAIYLLFKIYRQVPCKNFIFKSTCLILFASIFYYPYIIFFPLPWIILSIIRPFEIKEWLMPLAGLALVLFYIVLIQKINTEAFKFHNFDNLIAKELLSFQFSVLLKIVFGLMLLGCCSSLLFLIKLNAKSTNRFRKLTLLLFFIFIFFFILSILNYFYYFNVSIVILISSIPVALLLPFSLIHVKQKWISEIYLSSILILIFYNLIFT